jgi:TIR domain
MFGKKKYSIAFSVSESDIEKAEELHGLLLKKGISCYLYSKDRLPTLSRNLFEETLNIYMKKARHVLLVASKDFNKGTWVPIEERIIELVKTKKKDYLILIKLDDVEVGWAENIGYLQYKGDWKPIVKDVVGKISESKRIRVRKRLLITLAICSLLIVLPLLFWDTFFLGKMVSRLTIPDMNKVVKKNIEPSKDSHVVKVSVPTDKNEDSDPIKPKDSIPIPPKKNLLVIGRVEDEEGKPIKNADVTLLGKTKKTDLNGSFLFELDTMPYGGEYRIVCKKEGYEPYNKKYFESTKTDIEIILKSIDKNL